MTAVVIGILLASARASHAHGPASAIQTASPSGWDVAVMLLLAMGGLLYVTGSRALAARGARVRRIERVSFWTGWAALFAAVAPPMDAATASAFSAHMAQHELLMLVGAPLMIVGRPIVPWLWALPARLRPAAGASLQRNSVANSWALLTTPVVAWALHGATVWIWHAPVLYQAALLSEGTHALQHATFVGTAVLFWWGLVYGRYGRAAYGASALFVFTTMVHTGILGALFALSTSPYYEVYRERAAASGADPVADQQLAGLYMWVPSGIVLTVFGLALLVAWLSEAERRARALKFLIVLAIVGLAGCSDEPGAQQITEFMGGNPAHGRELIPKYGCDTCHTIPGVATADATVGPPLTKVARRLYLAGHVENTPENMQRWIQHPHAHEPETVMPEMGVTDSDSRDIVAYLYTLR
jgi:putative membrane protein